MAGEGGVGGDKVEWSEKAEIRTAKFLAAVEALKPAYKRSSKLWQLLSFQQNLPLLLLLVCLYGFVTEFSFMSGCVDSANFAYNRVNFANNYVNFSTTTT